VLVFVCDERSEEIDDEGVIPDTVPSLAIALVLQEG